MAHCNNASTAWTSAMTRAEKRMDPNLMHTLATLRHHIAEIDRLARDARHGKYQDR